MTDDRPDAEASRLEHLWAGDFGDDYVDRNADAYAERGRFWASVIERTAPDSVLEVGCNLGGNLGWIVESVARADVHGIDVNEKAIIRLHERLPGVNAISSSGRDIPFRDRWFDLVFTMGVLIHQPESTLPLVMAEMARCSARYVLFGEYYAPTTQEVAYRGHDGALFRRDYGGIFQELQPDWRLQEQGFLSRDDGWDDITWWLFER